MSVKVMSQVIQHYHGAGGEYTLALCLADFANNEGSAIWPAVATLAHNSRQSERTVQRQLKAMVDTGWLVIVDAGGGAGRATRYRIDPRWVDDPLEWLSRHPEAKSWRAAGAGHNPDHLNPAQTKKGDTGVTVSDPEKGDTGVTLLVEKRVTSDAKKGDTAMSPEPSVPTIKAVRPTSDESGCAEPSDGFDGTPDRKLADWMFGLVLKLHPKHKPPNWRRWCREIRLMRERDGRSQEQIAVLFRWANAHRFWHRNILSPGKLREQWDKLIIERRAEGGAAAAGEAADYQCVKHSDRRGKRSIPGVGWCCAECVERVEREAAHV